MMSLLTDVLSRSGLAALGLSMPLISRRWTDGAASQIVVDEATMAINLSGARWLAPLGGTLRKIQNDSELRVTLIRHDGNPLTGQGMLLTVHSQAYLRLARLYAQILEPATPDRPERDQGLPLRPVPRHFFYGGVVFNTDQSGNIHPEGQIDKAGQLTIHDQRGLPIDPLAVASALLAIINRYPILQARPPGEPPAPVAGTQLNAIAGLAPSVAQHVRLADPAGAPRATATNLNGLAGVHPPAGLYRVTGSTIGLDAASASFPAEQRRLMLLGPATTGRQGERFAVPATPSGVTLRRDYFNVQVVKLDEFLRGESNAGFAGAQAEQKPPIRLNEPLALLTDGNDILGAASAALAGTPTDALCVAQALDGDFPAPSGPGPAAHWPDFPAAGGTTPAPPGPLPVNLRHVFNPSAAWFDDGDATTANVDVILALNNLPPGAAVRVFPRKFIPQDYDQRGDGAGGVVADSGVLQLRLPDPLALRRPGLADNELVIPAQATLWCDVMVVKRSGERRLYGNVEAAIGAATASDPTQDATNPFTNAARRGVCHAGILGLGGAGGSLPSGALDVLIALTGEGTPRNASRWPTMARRDLLVAGLAGGNWRAVLAGGRLSGETHSAQQRLGAPGSRGGRETQYAGVATQNGRLAYDIARMALRRTTHIAARMSDLTQNDWSEPAELGATDANAGLFAGVVLQTIAPSCETPELNSIKELIDPSAIPANFDDLVDWLVERIDIAMPSGTPARDRLIDALTTRLSDLKDSSSIDQSTKERLYSELHREVMSAIFGRRDAQWALKSAIARAQSFIYIESPGFAATRKDDYAPNPVPPYAEDLITQIGQRMNLAPGLHVIICTPKHPDYGLGYEAISAHEVHDRRERILGLPTAQEFASRVVPFHPLGFPGRPSRLESTVVIVDDVWAMIGSSAFRRRGLTFDGGSDLVFTETRLVNGRSPAIAEFRRRLIGVRLGIEAPDPDAVEFKPDPNFIRLDDGVETFYLIREMLQAGGLGKIARLWNGRLPGIEPIPHNSVSQDLANPEGQEFPLADILAQEWLAGWNSF